MGRKQLEADILDAAPPTIEPGSKQRYARVLGPRGNHQHEVEFTDGHRTLVTLQPRFRHIVWVKRGHFVLVDPSIGTTSEKVGGEIIFVYFPQHIKQLEQAGQWPTEFSQRKKNEEDEDDLLFVNNNRPVMSETESESSDEE